MIALTDRWPITISTYSLRFKQNEQLKRKGGSKRAKLTGITKLDDANFAGTAKGKDCTLILTEGDSAKSLAISGLSIVGRDYYGVFPLKVRLVSHAHRRMILLRHNSSY